MLHVNADDWGYDGRTTRAILSCVEAGAVTAVSAMTHMAGSVEAAVLAQHMNADIGLHLNLTEPFTGRCAAPLRQAQLDLASCLRATSLARVLYHSRLAAQFEYVVRSQLDEFERLYGRPAARIDGHHHAHLSTNVLAQKLLPAATTVRRNFTFYRGEKSWLNRSYRAMVDRHLRKRHSTRDHLFNLNPIHPEERLIKIITLGHTADVELETHPALAEEYLFLQTRWLNLLSTHRRV